MVLKRRLDGRWALHGCVKVWGPVVIILALVFGATIARIADIRACQAAGGAWMGGFTRSAFCAVPAEGRAVTEDKSGLLAIARARHRPGADQVIRVARYRAAE
jgi:hypothetical protein